MNIILPCYEFCQKFRSNYAENYRYNFRRWRKRLEVPTRKVLKHQNIMIDKWNTHVKFRLFFHFWWLSIVMECLIELETFETHKVNWTVAYEEKPFILGYSKEYFRLYLHKKRGNDMFLFAIQFHIRIYYSHSRHLSNLCKISRITQISYLYIRILKIHSVWINATVLLSRLT